MLEDILSGALKRVRLDAILDHAQLEPGEENILVSIEADEAVFVSLLLVRVDY